MSQQILLLGHASALDTRPAGGANALLSMVRCVTFFAGGSGCNTCTLICRARTDKSCVKPANKIECVHDNTSTTCLDVATFDCNEEEEETHLGYTVDKAVLGLKCTPDVKEDILVDNLWRLLARVDDEAKH
jgi:hypothetical protein